MSQDEQDNHLRYDKMVEQALRGVVRSAIAEVMEVGLPGDHHFYITFLTDHPGVQIPDYLEDRYPGEMTIVLQYQFEDLEVDDEFLRVTLSFNNVPERLVIPISAITIFADPSVNFALQFQPMGEAIDPDDGGGGPDREDDTTDSGDRKEKGDDDGGEVISLDNFRKK